MKRLISLLSFILIFSILIVISILSTTGYETNRFNDIVTKKIIENNQNISLEIKKIKFKFDLKDLSLFLQTNNSKLKFQNLNLPIKIVKIYIDIGSIIKSKIKINKVNISLDKIDSNQLKAIIIKTKPTNLSSLITNKVNQGIISLELDLYFNENSGIKNYIVKGDVNAMDVTISKKLNLKKTSFNFFADNSDILIKNIKGLIDGVTIKEGSLQIARVQKEIKVKSNLITEININKNNIDKYLSISKDIKYNNKEGNINASLTHNIDVTFDETFKVSKYIYTSNGKVNKFLYKLGSPVKSQFLENSIDNIYLKKTDIIFRHSSDKKNYINLDGSYSFNNKDYKSYNFKSNFLDKYLDIEMIFKFDQKLSINLINYTKEKNKIAKINLKVEKNRDVITFKKINYTENKNLISINDLKINTNNLISLKEAKVKTFKNNIINNDFTLNFNKKIKIYGKKYDAKNLNKLINRKSKKNILDNINKSIEIDLEKIETSLSKELKNFKLIGSIKKGKFIKIISKGDFGNNKYLDISLKSGKKNKKKYLEIYSDYPQALLSEFSFFKGLSDGKLLYTSIIDGDLSNSKLIIEDFKIINAPGVVKLLSLADFGGLADLAEGEGLTFEKLEINISDDKKILRIDELYAVGPSISVLMDGYNDKNNGMTSLRGTLVPAKNLNKILSKIPVIGNIIIPKQVGEGLFGVSFKMKGPTGKIKTTINPIKTLTPRFITKALEKSKQSK